MCGKVFGDDFLEWHKAPSLTYLTSSIYNWPPTILPKGVGLGLLVHLNGKGLFIWDLIYVTLNELRKML